MMSEEQKTEKPDMVIAKLTMPDGKDYEIPMAAKVFKSGRHGFYTQIPPIVYDGEIYGGQIQVWKK